LLAFTNNASAQSNAERIDVFEVKGIIDGPVERSIINGIRDAERADAALVALQIDSHGVVGHARLNRITRAITASDVPVLAWVGPPGAEAANGAAHIFMAATMRAMAPASTLGPLETLDLRTPDTSDREATPFDEALNALDAEDEGVVEIVEPSLDAALDELDLAFDPDDAQIRFHKLDILGRVLHAAAQPSIVYLLLLLALVGIVFELFHPSNGPAGISGLVAGALAVYGIVALGGSWIGVALIVAGVTFFCVDLRYESLGAFTLGGLVALIAGSLLLFPSPWLRISPWILAFGIISMVMFLVGAMTRVLRDLRAIARGELEVTDAHAHLEGDDDDA
jgi:membrane-bound serine protease (ClpP class)